MLYNTSTALVSNVLGNVGSVDYSTAPRVVALSGCGGRTATWSSTALPTAIALSACTPGSVLSLQLAFADTAVTGSAQPVTAISQWEVVEQMPYYSFASPVR